LAQTTPPEQVGGTSRRAGSVSGGGAGMGTSNDGPADLGSSQTMLAVLAGTSTPS